MPFRLIDRSYFSYPSSLVHLFIFLKRAFISNIDNFFQLDKYTLICAIFLFFYYFIHIQKISIYSIASEFLVPNIVVYCVKFFLWNWTRYSWPMFTCNTKLRVSAPDNTTIAAGAAIAENLHVNCFLYSWRRKCYSDEKSRIADRLPLTEVTNKQVVTMYPQNSAIWLLIHANMLFERNNVK